MLIGASGARKKWTDIFEGKNPKHRLELGYYAVRLPLDDERKRNITRKELSQLANRFFAANSPWRDLQHLNRLGIDVLVRDISRLLMMVLNEAYVP